MPSRWKLLLKNAVPLVLLTLGACTGDAVSPEEFTGPPQELLVYREFETKQVAAGEYHTCAIKTDDTVACWGRNHIAQTTIPSGLGTVSQVLAGAHHTCAIKTDGTLACWGNNSTGQTTLPSDLGTVQQVAAGGFHTCAIKSDGTLACWGYNNYGQATVPSDLGTPLQVTAGKYHTCAIKTDGTVACWGYSFAGQVPSDFGTVQQIEAGGAFSTCAIKSDDTLACWGFNSEPLTVPSDLGTVRQVVAGGDHTCAIKSNETLLCWGDNYADNTIVPAGLGTVQQVDAGAYHNCVIKSDDTLACWGDNAYGQTTVPITAAHYTPTATFTAPRWVQTGASFDLALSNAEVVTPDSTFSAADAGIQYAFDCGDGTGYNALSSNATVSCTAGAAGSTQTVKGRVQDEDGDVSEYTVAVPITVTIPATPSDAAFTVVGTSVDLTWTDNATDEDRYVVRRRHFHNGVWSTYRLIEELPANATSHTDTGLVARRRYEYMIRACNDGGCGVVMTDAFDIGDPPAVPTLPVIAIVGTTSIAFGWSDNSSDESEFRIARRERGESGWSTYAQIGTTVADDAEYVDATAVAGVTYQYYVRACAVTGCSAAMMSERVTVPTRAPARVDSITVTSSGGALYVSWTDRSRNEAYFQVERREYNGSWSAFALLAQPTNASYNDSSVTIGTRYQYRVRACNVVGCSKALVSLATVAPASD